MKSTKVLFLSLLALLSATHIKAQTFDVQHYELNINVPNSYVRYIEGAADIRIQSLQDQLNTVELMLQGLTVDSVKQGEESLSYTHNDTVLDIQLTGSYNSNELFSVMVYYHGQPGQDPTGWGGYYVNSGYSFNLGVSMSEDPHGYGRVWYPCVDNYTDKATYDFNITCQEQRTAVCGGTLINETNHGDGTKTYEWHLTKEIPTYLASMAVGNYVVYRDTFDGMMGEIPVAIYTRSSESANVAASFIHLESVFHILEDKFGAYRWSRIGYVGVPFSGGAMEHAENIAYPNSSIDGTLNSETLFAHELSHSWFGNLTTCSTAGDMWLNEGWASYCEAIVTEALYGEEAFKTYNRNRHKNNVHTLHFDEEGYWALYDIPTDLTYSGHVYKKGADVVHSLRNHLGDDVFFDVMRAFLDEHEYGSVSSYDLRNYINDNTPYNVDGFFDAWVFDGGWVHFSVDSFAVTPNAEQFDVEVFMKQKLKGKTEYAQNCRVPIQLMNGNFDRWDTVITFSGVSGSQAFTVPFEPTVVICDLDEKISDATTDRYYWVKEAGLINVSKSLFKTDVTQAPDSSLLRVEHHWVAPDNFIQPIEGLNIHPERYWAVDGVWHENFQANGQFYYSKSSSNHLDRDFITTHVDSLVVLYRAHTRDNWQIIPHTRNGSNYSGYLVIDNLQKGEYALGLWNHHVGTSQLQNKQSCNTPTLICVDSQTRYKTDTPIDYKQTY